jgi:hypothetical protein
MLNLNALHHYRRHLSFGIKSREGPLDQPDRWPELVADLLGHDMVLIAACDNFGARAAMAVTTTVPIVFALDVLHVECSKCGRWGALRRGSADREARPRGQPDEMVLNADCPKRDGQPVKMLALATKDPRPLLRWLMQESVNSENR